jgi:DNA-binding MarR family transcriptional regulator
MARTKTHIRPRKGPAADPAEPGSALDFMRVLWALDHALRSRSKQMSRKLGVTGPQRLVVRLVGRTPGIGAGALAEALHVHPSTLTGVVKRLCTRRILAKKPDPEDGRRTLLHLTERGRTLDRMRSGTVEAAVLHVLSSLDERSVATTRRLLERIIAELGRKKPS